MRLFSMALTLAALCAVATPCAAQALSLAAQQEIQRLENLAGQFGRQTVNPVFCLQAKQKAAQWRARAATLASPWKENLLASADKQEAAAGQCQQRGAGSKADADYSLAQANRIKNHQPLLLPQRSASVTAKYNLARKNVQEIIAVLNEAIQRMAAAAPRLQRLVGKPITIGALKGNRTADTISQQDVGNAMGALAQVRAALESAQDKVERMNFQFADKFTTDAYLEDPRYIAFDISSVYTNALNATEFEWVMLGNEIAWQLKIEQVDAIAWADREAQAALIDKQSDRERSAGLAAAQNNPGKMAVLGNRKGPEALLKFEAATQPGIEAYCARYQNAAANQAVVLAAKVQAAADVLTQRRNLLMQVRKRLAADLAYPADLNRNGRTPLDFPDKEFSSAWATPWPPGIAFSVAVPGYGHPDAYHVSTRIGFIECPDWRDKMPKDIAARFHSVTPVFSGNGTAALNVNLVNPLVLEGEAEGRAPEQRL